MNTPSLLNSPVAFLNANTTAARGVACFVSVALAVGYFFLMSTAWDIGAYDVSILAAIAMFSATFVAVRSGEELIILAVALLVILGAVKPDGLGAKILPAAAASIRSETAMNDTLARIYGRAKTFEAAQRTVALIAARPSTLDIRLDEQEMVITASHDLAFVASGVPRISGASSETVRLPAGNFDLFASFMARNGYLLSRKSGTVSLVAMVGR